MLAKVTAKNQPTLPKSVVQAVGATGYFDVEARGGQIVLTPVRIQRGDAVRAKIAALGLGETDATDAMRWARTAGAPLRVMEAVADYGTGRHARKSAPRKPAARRN
ncbi:MAG: AbrB/MazE/SpoVT family DNA-binding domain-containing protein [Betaproteobacteria bacterium]